MRLPRSDRTRCLLLPYTIILFVLNTAFAITQNILAERETIEQPAQHDSAWYLAGECPTLNVVHSILVTLPIFFNDALFLFRVGQVTQWHLKFMALPCIIYLVSVVLGVYSIPDYLSYCNASDLLPPNLNTSIVFTAVLNLGLGAIIVYKLYWSRRSIAAYTHNCRQTSWHTRLMAFIIESALLWVVTAFLNIVTTVEDTFGDAAPFFDLLFIITTIISPTLLTYQIARDKQAELPAETSSSHSAHSCSAKLVEAEAGTVGAGH